MKGNMFCASQASTAICSMSMDHHQASSSSSSSSSTIHLGSTPFIDRHNPIIRDGRRIPPKNIINTPCSFQAPISPKPHKNHHKNQNNPTKPRDYLALHKKKSKKQIGGGGDDGDDQKKKKKSSISSASAKEETDVVVKNKSYAKPIDLFTPPGSSRYLLGGDTAFFNVLSDIDPVLALVPAESKKIQAVKTDESSSSSSKRCSSSRSPDQVVVLRVSLHCKGCEGKVRKHISRMAGVTSFSIDFAAKKVTVVGDVTPLSVLASISKVKNAQLLAPAMLSSSSSTTTTTSNHPSSVGSNYIATNK